MTSIATTAQPEHVSGRRRPRGRPGALPGAVICGAVVGVIQAVSPLGFWWLEPKTVYALGLTLITAVTSGSAWPMAAATSSPSRAAWPDSS